MSSPQLGEIVSNIDGTVGWHNHGAHSVIESMMEISSRE